jgi:hypothetical protein
MQVLSHHIYENVFLTQNLPYDVQRDVTSATTPNQYKSEPFSNFSPAKTNEKNKINRYDF